MKPASPDTVSTAAPTERTQPNNTVFTDTGLSIIEVCGQDRSKFLQGQLTCNIDDLSESQASIAAMCNAKGRVISTLIIVKTPQTYLLIVPADLLETVLKKLRMYVLRADVQLLDQTNCLGILGVQSATIPSDSTEPLLNNFAVAATALITIKLPAMQRYLSIGSLDKIAAHRELLSMQQGYSTGSIQAWRYQDISSALPWFDASQSEQHIPQMLNIDQLGGISFSKGCYTGQEIIARTHYLGKVKRGLFVAECDQSPNNLSSGCAVQDGKSLQNVGEVLAFSRWQDKTRLLLVLQIVDGEPKNFILGDEYRSPLAIITHQ